jgi:ATP-dependent Zn protease
MMNKAFVVVLILVVFTACNRDKPEMIRTNVNEFIERVRNGDVEKISVFEERKTVEVFLNQNAIRKFIQQHKKGFTERSDRYGPHMQFKITGRYAFSEQMNNFYKANPDIRRVPDGLYFRQ